MPIEVGIGLFKLIALDLIMNIIDELIPIDGASMIYIDFIEKIETAIDEFILFIITLNHIFQRVKHHLDEIFLGNAIFFEVAVVVPKMVKFLEFFGIYEAHKLLWRVIKFHYFLF